MDVADILAIETPAVSTVLLILAAVFLVPAGLSVYRLCTDNAKRRVHAASVRGFFCIATVVVFAASIVTGVFSDQSSEQKYDRFKASLFSTYGITSPVSWSRVQDAGEAGFVTDVEARGRELPVLIKLDGETVSVTGADGRELRRN